MSKITLIRLNHYTHVSQDAIIDFEKEIVCSLNCEIKYELPIRFLKYLGKLYYHFPEIFRLLSAIKINKNLFIVLMGGAVYTKFPLFAFTCKHKVLYLFDAWEPRFPEIKNMIENLKIDIVFFTYRQSYEYFKETLPQVKCFWVPEAISFDEYYAMPYSQKDIDILQLGRRFGIYHNKIVNFCFENNLKYLYERKRGEIIFPKRIDFIKGLARSKISICVPSSITHPLRSGYISGLTQRYLQSMASKCLIVGYVPEDIKYLFDYNPIIQIDIKNPTEQIDHILKNFSKYVPLIEKNYLEVKEKHQWKNRVAVIQGILEENL
mgnify:CR=1 FL=1